MSIISHPSFTPTRLRLAFTTMQIASFAAVAALGSHQLGVVTGSLATFFCIAPSVAIAGVGRIRPHTLLIWSVVFTGLAALLPASFEQSINGPSGGEGFVEGVILLSGIAALLFASHSFVVAGEADRRWIASYSTYVITAWTLVVQALLLVLGFAALWVAYGLLSIFDDARSDSVKVSTVFMQWGFLPATSLTILAVFELSDRCTRLINAARVGLMTLLSWSLPFAVVGGLVLVAKVAAPDARALWRDFDAFVMWPAAAAILILLINVQFDADGVRVSRFHVLTIARLTAVCLLPAVVGLFATGVFTRYFEHGWTPQNVSNVGYLAVMGCYGGGYAITALTSGPCLKQLPAINVVTALLAIALTVAAATPLFSPTRLAVASQVSRLDAGRIAPDQFNYGLLAHYAYPYGRPALEQLIERRGGPEGDEIARRAHAALNADPRRRN